MLRPGRLDRFDRSSTIRRAERDHGVVLRITDGTRELLHEAFSVGVAELDTFCATVPRAYAEALRDARVAKDTIDIWAAVAGRWASRA